jgi:hypothetical protein
LREVMAGWVVCCGRWWRVGGVLREVVAGLVSRHKKCGRLLEATARIFGMSRRRR